MVVRDLADLQDGLDSLDGVTFDSFWNALWRPVRDVVF